MVIFHKTGYYFRYFIHQSAQGKAIKQTTVSEEEILQTDLRNNEVRWRNICQRSHSRPKYLSLKERCEEQRGHRGRKTLKQGEQAVWEVVIFKCPQYYALKNNLIFTQSEKLQ